MPIAVPDNLTPGNRWSIGSGMQTRPVDVLVLGGGMAGSFAAMAARGSGASVVVVEPSNVLGGQGTAGGVAGFVGDTARVNPDFQEMVERLARCGAIDPYRPNDDRRAYDLELCAFTLQEMLAERGVEILLHARALDARREGGMVTDVLVVCGPTLLCLCPRIVVDATGNAVIPHMLGDRTVALGAGVQLPMSLYFTLWNAGAPVRPVLPSGCPRWEDDADLPMTSLHEFANGKVEVKMKVVGFDASDGTSLSHAEIHARRQMMGLIFHLQTKGYRGRHAVNNGKPLDCYALASVSRTIGQREGRRIVGRHMLVEAEITRGTRFPDAVAVGTYHLDFHWPDTEKRAGTGITTMVEPYHIPLRAMLPEGIDNVLCPGRSMSGDQMALSSFRAMATCAQMGWGAGHAASASLETGATLPRLDSAILRARIEAAGQVLDLSQYGDYLRCLRLTHETALPGSAPVRGNHGLSLSVSRGRDARTSCVVRDAGTREVLALAIREDGAWQARSADEAPAEPAAGPLGPVAPGLLQACGPVAIGDGTLACAGHRARGTGSSLAACLSGDGGGSWDRTLDIAHDAAPGTAPAIMATPVGLAVVYRAQDGMIRYWEGAVERFGPVGGLPPEDAALQRLPYLNHIQLPDAMGV